MSPLRNRLSRRRLGEHDRLSLREEDPELEAEGARLPPEVADLSFGFPDDSSSGRREAMTLFVYSDGSFSVGTCATVSHVHFNETVAAVNRAKALVDALGLRPKVWPRRA